MMTLKINGTSHEVEADPKAPLLWVLREKLGFTNVKYGCGIGLCGACTVHVDGLLAFLPLLRRSSGGRIVNVSSMLGSIAKHEQPDSPIYDCKAVPAYNVSKTAVNAWTVQLAWELRNTPIKVNAADPGYVRTEMSGSIGDIDVSDGARTSVWLALLGPEGPSGGFFHAEQRLPW